MEVVAQIPSLWTRLAEARGAGQRIALVPTMGALHDGHLSLVDRAREDADVVVVSVFVNPLQFGEGEDLDVYPRELERDARLAEAHGADLLFAPTPEQMYPEGSPQVSVDPGPLANRLCGVHRPGHFRGVLTVVCKLFNIVGPDVAVFGRKDFQQSVLIRRMVADLNLDLDVRVAPIVREPDGTALSSRNRYLSAAQRTDASGISLGLRAAAARFAEGERAAARLRAAYHAVVGKRAHLAPQYDEVVDPDSLASLDEAVPGSVLAVAAYCGETRLIDNIVLGVSDGF